jgi:hypothetical protein
LNGGLDKKKNEPAKKEQPSTRSKLDNMDPSI